MAGYRCIRRPEAERHNSRQGTNAQHEKSLDDHVKDYRDHLEVVSTCKKYVQRATQQVTAVLNGCGFKTPSQISGSSVEKFLAELSTAGLSPATRNQYLSAIRTFVRWLYIDRRMEENPLAYLRDIKEEVDRRRFRRALMDEEFERLLSAAQYGPKIVKIEGPDRLMMYLIAAYTGCRRNEIGSIREDSFNFDSSPPTMTVAAVYSKRKRCDVIPLRRDLAIQIQSWISARPRLLQNQLLLDIGDKNTSKMIRFDLASARTRWIDEAADINERYKREKSGFLKFRDNTGRVADFHSLRMTFISNLARGGVWPQAAQLLARHSNIDTTLRIYTSLGKDDLTHARDALPPIPDWVLRNAAYRSFIPDDNHKCTRDRSIVSQVPEGDQDQESRVRQRMAEATPAVAMPPELSSSGTKQDEVGSPMSFCLFAVSGCLEGPPMMPRTQNSRGK